MSSTGRACYEKVEIAEKDLEGGGGRSLKITSPNTHFAQVDLVFCSYP